MFLKLVMYKNVAKVYIVGGTKESIFTLDNLTNKFDILSSLSFYLNKHFWDEYKGLYNKGKLIDLKDEMDTANKIKELMDEKYN